MGELDYCLSPTVHRFISGPGFMNPDADLCSPFLRYDSFLKNFFLHSRPILRNWTSQQFAILMAFALLKNSIQFLHLVSLLSRYMKLIRVPNL